MSNERKVHYSFFQDKPTCGVRGKIYITSEKFYVTCKACLRYLNDVKRMVLEDEKSYVDLIKTVNIEQHWRQIKKC